MDLLESVGAAYRGLRSLKVEMRVTQEIEAEGQYDRKRVRAAYLAPDWYRYEEGGGLGNRTVMRGAEGVFCLGGRYRRVSGTPARGVFDPRHPQGAAFVFGRIAEDVEWVKVDEGDGALTVVYTTAERPVKYWIDQETKLVRRMECEYAFRHPGGGEAVWTRQSVEVVEAVVDGELEAELFSLEAPAGAKEIPGGGGIGGAVGGSSFGSISSIAWEGSTAVETSKLRFRGVTVELKRRVGMSEDGRVLRVEDTVVSPAGERRFEHTISMVPE